MQAGFSSKRSSGINPDDEQMQLVDKLYRQIGKLSTECEWLKKNLKCLSSEQRKSLIDETCSLSIRRQCQLLTLSRSNLYYNPTQINEAELAVVNKVDEIYTEHPYYGTRRMVETLSDYGISIGRQKVGSYYKLLGLEAVYPKVNLSKRNHEHKVYPYLLRYLPITRVNQVWSADITYIRLKHGFVYLVAIIDWYSRCILSWKVSTFTVQSFIGLLLKHQINISMDGRRGQALDNVSIKRFWRSLKQENIYLVELYLVAAAKKAISDYMDFYNLRRKHQSLDYKVPF